MSEFWIISNFLREKSEENIQTQKLCQQIAAKYMENEKNELLAQSILEENIALKLEVGNLESICHTVTENEEAQAKLHSLLEKLYEEHLKITFDIDECEMEKIFSYEEIKTELDTRETVEVYQTFYQRKMEMATRMEERNIVQRYRKTQQELSRTQDERLKLEDSIKQLREKAEEAKMRKSDLHDCIYRLVKGSKDLENMYSRHKHIKLGTQNKNAKWADKARLFGSVKRTVASDKIPQKGGLSSRLLLDFNQFKIPEVPALPKIRKINPSKGFSRLLQQAEVLRKSMQRNVALPQDLPTPKPLSILRIPTEGSKASKNSPKTVSFETKTAEETPDTPPSIPQITLNTNISAITVDSESQKNLCENTQIETINNQIEILENIIIKPADTPLPLQPPSHLPMEDHTELPIEPKINKKRKIVEENYDSYAAEPPPKKNHKDTDNAISLGSKSFMDMFLEFSNETPTTSASIVEPKKRSTQDVEEPKISKFDAKPDEKRDEMQKAKKSKASFDDFEDFFSGLAGNASENDLGQSPADMSFDFFDKTDNPNDEDGAGSSFSFKF